MALNVIPPLLLSGIFTLRAPFTVVANTKYTVEAVRTYDEMIRLNVDIVAQVYTPVGLTKTSYDEDVLALAKLVSLTAPGLPTVYVPTTYIDKLPDDTAVSYDYVVLSISMGAVPSTLVDQLQQTTDEIQGVVSDLTGVVPTIEVNIAPSAGTVTAEQHRLNEQNRLSAIKRRNTEHAELIAANATIEQLRLIIADYEQRLTS